MAKGVIEIFPDVDGKSRFRVKSRNGKIVAAGEGYYDPRNAERGANALIAIIKSGAKINHVKK